MKRNNSVQPRSGAITVFFSIIFLSLILLTMTTVDAIRIEAAKVDAQRAMNMAGRSMLTEYNYEIANEYGIIAFNSTNNQEIFEQYLDSNLPSENNDLMSHIYDIQVKEGSVVPKDTKLTTGEMKYLILEYMKYRAPLMSLTPFLEKLEAVIKAGKTTDELSAKVKDVDSKMDDLADEYENLRRYIEGWYLEDNLVKYSEEKYVDEWDEARLFNEGEGADDGHPSLDDLAIKDKLANYSINLYKLKENYAITSRYLPIIQENYDAFQYILVSISEIRENQLQVHCDAILEEVTDKEEEIVDKEDEITSKESAITSKESSISGISTAISNLDPLDPGYASAKSALETEKDGLEEDLEDLEEDLEDLEDELEVLEDRLVELKVDQQVVDDMKAAYELCETTTDDTDFLDIYSLIDSPFTTFNEYETGEATGFQWTYKDSKGNLQGIGHELASISIDRVGEDDSDYVLSSIVLEDDSPNSIKDLFDSITSLITHMDKTGEDEDKKLQESYKNFVEIIVKFEEFRTQIMKMTNYVNRRANQFYTEIEEFEEYNDSAFVSYQNLYRESIIALRAVRLRLESIANNEGDMLLEAKEQLLLELKEDERILLEILGEDVDINITLPPANTSYIADDVSLDDCLFIEEGSIGALILENLVVLDILLSKEDTIDGDGDVRAPVLSFVHEDIGTQLGFEILDINVKDLFEIEKVDSTASVTINDFLDKPVQVKNYNPTVIDSFEIQVGDTADYYMNHYLEQIYYPLVDAYSNEIRLDDRNPQDYVSAESLHADGGVVDTPELNDEDGNPIPTPDENATTFFDTINNFADGDLTGLVTPEGGTVPVKYKDWDVKRQEIPVGTSLYSTTIGVAPSVDVEPSKKSGKEDLKDGKTESSTNVLDAFSGFASKIGGMIESIRNELYVNEYIMGLFKTRTTGAKFQILQKQEADPGDTDLNDFVKDNTISNDSNFKGQDLIESLDADNMGMRTFKKEGETDESESATQLAYEVEYILSGRTSDQENIDQMRLKLLMVRIPLNLIYLYTHSPERDLAYSAATVLTFGIAAFLIPVVQFLILFAWAYAEAEVDIKLLFNGWKVAFMKSADTFTLTFNVAKAQDIAMDLAEKGISAAAGIAIGYIDTATIELKNTLDGYLTGAFAEVSDVVGDQLYEAIDEAEAYAMTLTNDFTSSFDLFIKEAVREMIRNNSLDIDDITTIPGYESLILHIEPSEVESLLVYIKQVCGTYNLETITEYQIDEIIGLVMDIGIVSLLVTTTITEIKDAATAYADGIMTEFNTQLEALKTEFGDMASVPIDRLNTQLTSIVETKSQDLAASATKYIEAKWPEIDLAEGATGGVPKKSFITAFKFKYEDYLRLFLLFVNEDDKIARTMDLIQLNHHIKTGEEFNISNYSVAYEAEATFEIDYLFIPWIYNVLNDKELTNTTKTISLKTVQGY